MVPPALDPAARWPRVMGPDGFLAAATLDGLKEGNRFQWHAANGDRVSGIVQMAGPPAYFAGSLEEADDALFGITALPPGVMLTFVFYGPAADQAQAVRERWTKLVQDMVGQSSRAAAPATA